MSEVKSWIEPLLRLWASQKRRAMTGVREFSDGTVHEDGWSSRSSGAMAFDGGITGGVGAHTQTYAEVYSGDALAVWRALAEAPAEIREIVFEHYIAKGYAETKALRLDISTRVYWQRLQCAYFYLAGCLSRPREPAAFEPRAVIR